MASVHVLAYTFPLYIRLSVGFGVAYLRMVGNAKASASGMSNSSDTRASFFGVFLRITNQIKMDLALGCRAAEKKENYFVMRKRVLLTVICILSVILAMAQRTNPDVADYFIKGYLSIERGNDGKPVYKLSDIQKKGINFDDPGSVVRGFETDKEDVRFQFSHYTTNYPGGIGTPLDFWRYDEYINEWQPDIETRQGSAGVQEKKSMVLMLVLDCSSSLSSDFSFVQQAAKEFIKSLLDASGVGNIKIGIVGFSKISATEFFPITRLTADSYYDMCRFINGRNVQNGTALYYAMDKAIDAMDSYCTTSISSDEPLSSAMMVTFTDGLDQTSRDENRGIYTADDYYIELQRKMNNKRFNGVPLQSKMRGVRGVDIATEAQLGKFSQIGNSLAEFKLLRNMSELGLEFKYIAEGLINEWRVLNCYVPNSFKGKVAWTYPSRKQVVDEKPLPKKKGKWFVGFNAGLGISSCYNYIDSFSGFYDDEVRRVGFAISGGVDVAFPIGRALNVGLFTSVGYETAGKSVVFDIGPLLLVNFKNSSSLYFGGGLAVDYYKFDGGYYGNYGDIVWHGKGYGSDWRVGYKFSNGLYLAAEVFATSVKGSEQHKEIGLLYRKLRGSIFHIGYSF